jgi:hypothetical protein
MFNDYPLWIAIKVGSLKCYVIQLNSSSVDVTIKEVKYVTKIKLNKMVETTEIHKKALTRCRS